MPMRFSFPLYVKVDVTSRCCLNCLYCSNPQQFNTADELSTDELISLIQYIARQGALGIVFSGGEPTLHSDLIKLVTTATRLGLHTTLNTSGFIFDVRLARMFNSAGLRVMTINIEGACALTHDAIRGRCGSWQNAVNTIRLCNKVNSTMEIVVNSVIMRQNYKEIRELLNFVQTLPIRSHAVELAVPTGRALENKEALLDNKEVSDLVKVLKHYTRETKLRVPISPPHRLDEFKKKDESKETSAITRFCLPSCELYTTSLTVNAKGEVFPCNFHRDTEFVIGNIRTEPLKEIWESARERGPKRKTFCRCQIRSN